MKTIKWNKKYENKGPLPVYRKYSGQNKPQPARLYLTEDGEAGFDYNPEINGEPIDEWEGRTLTWIISPYLTVDQLDEIANDEEINVLLEKVHTGHTVEWDGSKHRGHLTDDAADASIDLQTQLDERYGIGEGTVIENPLDAVESCEELIELFIDGNYASIDDFYAGEFSGGVDGVTVYDFGEEGVKEKLVECMECKLDEKPDEWKKWPEALQELAYENGLLNESYQYKKEIKSAVDILEEYSFVYNKYKYWFGRTNQRVIGGKFTSLSEIDGIYIDHYVGRGGIIEFAINELEFDEADFLGKTETEIAEIIKTSSDSVESFENNLVQTIIERGEAWSVSNCSQVHIAITEREVEMIVIDMLSMANGCDVSICTCDEMLETLRYALDEEIESYKDYYSYRPVVDFVTDLIGFL